MRLSRFGTVILVVAIFLLVLDGLLLFSYQGAQADRTRLFQQLRAIEVAIGRLSNAPGSLAGADAFPRNVPSVELTDLVVRAAQDNGVQLVSMQSNLGGTEKIRNNSYRAITLSVAVRGQASQLSAFFRAIESGPVRTWVVDNIQLTPPPGSTPGGVWNMSLDISAYALPG